MLVGAVHGYRGLIRELLLELRRELKARRLARGRDRRVRAVDVGKNCPRLQPSNQNLTLEGLRLVWRANAPCPECRLQTARRRTA